MQQTVHILILLILAMEQFIREVHLLAFQPRLEFWQSQAILNLVTHYILLFKQLSLLLLSHHSQTLSQFHSRVARSHQYY
jgi:hypothetical protein